jgi:hypothetical protein
MRAKSFLDNLTKAVPYKVHNGIQFAKREGAEAYWPYPLIVFWHRTSADQGQSSLDQWPSETHVLDDPGGYGEALLLSVTRSLEPASACIPDGLQLRQTPRV